MHQSIPKVQLVRAADTKAWLSFKSDFDAISLPYEIVGVRTWKESETDSGSLPIVFCDRETLDLRNQEFHTYKRPALAIIPRNLQPPGSSTISSFSELLFWPCHREELLIRINRLTADFTPVNAPEIGAIDSEMLRRNLIGESAAFKKTVQLVKHIAHYDVTVLLEGETGTGKELIARALHYLSPRQSGPFVPVNCGSIPDSLFENELFGHQRGAYTDAKVSQTGMVSRAKGGTLFLDEVDTLSLRSQAAILRFLESQQFTPLGSQTTECGNVRIIAATNTNLAERVKSGRFRSDVLFRLDLLSIQIPPLRAREGDAELLAEHFMNYYSSHFHIPRKTLSNESRAWIQQYSWPGNVRELQNCIQKVVLLDEYSAFDLPNEEPAPPTECYSSAKMRAVTEFERRYLTQLLRRTCGSVTKAAKFAKKDRSAFGKLLKKHAIDWRSFRQPDRPPDNNDR